MPVTSYFRWCCLCLVPSLLAACQPPPPTPLAQQLYVWQRQWRPAHEQALAQSRADFSTLRVLALQAHPAAGWSRARVDLGLLGADGRPVIAVVRLDGQLPALDADKALEQISQLLADWQAAGVQPAGLEIDHDCASARLPGYSAFLQRLRASLPASLKLSITALPAWLDSPQLPALLQAVDSSVLQVHAVTDPRQGLFEPKQALRWAERWSLASDRPFYLALPAYGVAVLGHAGGVPLVESEMPLERAGQRRELLADPQQLAELAQRLRAKPPAHLAGLVWFRLPLPGDRRAWSLATLQAVAAGRPLQGHWQVQQQASDGLSELRLLNPGNLDRALPARIELAGEGCEAADGLNGYRAERSARGLTFIRQHDGRLAAAGQLALGWARCTRIEQGNPNVSR